MLNDPHTNRHTDEAVVKQRNGGGGGGGGRVRGWGVGEQYLQLSQRWLTMQQQKAVSCATILVCD